MHGKLKPIFHSLQAVDPETLSVSKFELYVTIANDFQPLTFILKIFAEFLSLHMATKDDY